MKPTLFSDEKGFLTHSGGWDWNATYDDMKILTKGDALEKRATAAAEHGCTVNIIDAETLMLCWYRNRGWVDWRKVEQA